MRRRDLLAIAATQQVRVMQEGAKAYRDGFYKEAKEVVNLKAVSIECCFTVLGNESNASVWQKAFSLNGARGLSFETAKRQEDTYFRVAFYSSGNSKNDGFNHIIGQFYHLIITRDINGAVTCFRNGQEIARFQTGAKLPTDNYIAMGFTGKTAPIYFLNGAVKLARIFNYALSTPQIAALYNNGKSEEYLLPAADKVGCVAEYLPQNLVTAHDGDMTDKTPIAWLDSAKQLPLNDEYLPPLLQSVGGYDLTALGTPEIVEKAR
ncbi:MAG: LamG-like jellyroll fold domain-containing protein [Alistipes sp.]